VLDHWPIQLWHVTCDHASLKIQLLKVSPRSEHLSRACVCCMMAMGMIYWESTELHTDAMIAP
jgi:hypothetical protein